MENTEGVWKVDRKDWMVSERRRLEIEHKAAAYQQADSHASRRTPRQILGQWLINTGESILEEQVTSWNPHESMRTSHH
jgi:hypothetical protein